MPFCTQCGGPVTPADQFCGGCGSRQASGPAPEAPASAPRPQTGPAQPAGDWLANITDRNASLLCYIPVVGWIASIVVLASQRFQQNREVRFHAFQGLYLFVIWLFVEWVFNPVTRNLDTVRHLGGLLKAVVLGGWIFMLVKTNQGENYRLPIIGELADRSVSEQR